MRGGSAGGSTPDVDATMVQTLPELVRTFNRLRGARSYAELDNAVNRRLADGPRALPASTLSNLLNGTSVPTRNTVVRFLTACGLDEQAQRPWLAAWERVSTNHLRRPPGAVRVREARPRLLGVHAAIQVDQDSGELPAYVPRDLDADLRTAITASERGGFVLLVGGSSVGKTRALFEAVRAVLPEWWLVHPADTDEIREFGLAPTPRTVLWLDDLQRYLNQPGGLPAGSVRALVAAGVVVAATVWPDEYSARVASRQSGRPDPYANDREVFGIAEVVAVADRFSAAERRRAEALAADRRIRVALDTTDAGFTQVLAAGPDLVRWWEQAPADQCYGKALITAALDALRAGAVAPLPRDYFAAAAPGYLTPAAQATAAPDWLDQGLAYATTWLHGAAATLTPVPAGMGQIAGYTVADYLHQHALLVRRTTPLPDSAWQALVDHHHPDDTMQLAGNAERRGRSAEAECLYRQAIESGDTSAPDFLAHLLAQQGCVEELRQRADAGDWSAADVLANLLADQGRVEELQAHADAGDGSAANQLADLLIKQGRVDEAITALSQPGVTDDWRAAERLADLLAAEGRVEDAITVLRQAVDAGEWLLTKPLSRLLAQQGHIEELRQRADSDSPASVFAAASLADLLAKLGRVEELQERADAGDGSAANRLAGLLAEQGRVDDAITALWQRADAGDGSAAYRAAELLAEQDRVDDMITIMRRPADAGDLTAANWLADLLAKRGRVEDLRERADAGDGLAANRLADLLADQGHVEELGQRADAGDTHAGKRLADLLAEQGRVEELRQRADAGDWSAANRLADLLVEQGRVDEATTVLRQPTNAGDMTAGDRLSDLLAQHGRLDELTDEVAAGTSGAAEQLAQLTASNRRSDAGRR